MALVGCTSGTGQSPPDCDAFSEARSSESAPGLADLAKGLVKTHEKLRIEERLGVPTFVWVVAPDSRDMVGDDLFSSPVQAVGLVQPARVSKVMYHLPGLLVPAYYFDRIVPIGVGSAVRRGDACGRVEPAS